MSTHESDNLRDALLRDMQYRKLSQAEYARAIGESVDRMKNAMGGRSEKGLRAIVESAKRAFSLPDNWPSAPLPVLTKTPLRPVPMAGVASAGPGAATYSDREPLFVPQDMCDELTVGWEVEGDSMYPWLRPHDIVVAQPVRSPVYGKAHIIRHLPSQEVSVKFIHAGALGPELRSVNRAYPAVQQAEFEVLGLVTGLYRSNPRPASGTLAAHDPNGLMPEFFAGIFTPPLD